MVRENVDEGDDILDECVMVGRDLIGCEEEWLEWNGQFPGKTDRENRTYIKQAMEVLEDNPLVLGDNETAEAEAVLRVLVELVHVAEGLEDGAEIDRATKNASDRVPPRPDRTHERLAIEAIRLRELRELRARVRATEDFTRQLQDLGNELNIILKTTAN